MKFAVAGLLLCSLAFVACKQNKKDMLLGSWRGVKLENPGMDSFFRQSQNYIDTLGKNGNPVTNMELYGSTNVDSLRKGLQIEFDSSKKIQMKAVLNTIFNFRKDSIVAISFNGLPDTSKWYIDVAGALQMEEMTGQGKNTKTQMDIVELTSSELKLRFQEDSMYSTVTFKREK